MKFIGIIPARYASTRFPGKPLADMDGKSMIQRVYEQACKALDEVWVATDDECILTAVEAFGGKAVLTSSAHRSGTDRCEEAFLKLGKDFDVIINIQGDEPFIKPEQIETLKDCFKNENTEIATLVKAFRKEDGFEALFNPNSPKVVINKNDEAIYFSRSIVPYIRDAHHLSWMDKYTFYKHIGMYAYRADVLALITKLPQSSLEIAESLEQLRWIENGFRIKIGYTTIETQGIDTPEDLNKALEFLKRT
ncbi:MAG: 3-deoxy-manno-octulosonate cytidylyltransferase [Dysgonomonas sp.]